MARNIYFAGSIRAGRADVEIYAHIVKLLKRYGAVLTEHVADSKIDENGTSILVPRLGLIQNMSCI